MCFRAPKRNRPFDIVSYQVAQMVICALSILIDIFGISCSVIIINETIVAGQRAKDVI
jgi:hypothetical protein